MPIDLSAVFGMPPEEAVKWFEQKGYAITWSWQDQWQEAHARAFTVAGVTKLEILEDIRTGLADALTNGKTAQQFADELTPLLQRKGWWGRDALVDKETGEITGKGLTGARLNLIYQQNLQTSFMAGRYQAMKAAVATHPFWQYVAVMDGRTRPAHALLNGRVFRHDDPIWSSIYPPNGFRCRCRVRPMTQRALEREDLVVTDSAPYTTEKVVPISPRRPEAGTTRVTEFKTPDMPKGFSPDPGFNYNPGAVGGSSYPGDLLLNKAVMATPDLAAQAVRQAAGNTAALQRMTDEFASWADAVEQGRGQIMPVGAFSPKTLERLAEHGIQPQSAVIAVRDDDVLHTHRETKPERLPWDWYRELPRYLAKPKAVLLEQRPGKPADVLLVFAAADDKTARLVVKVDFKTRERVEGERVDLVINIVRTGKLVDPNNLKGSHITVLEGEL